MSNQVQFIPEGFHSITPYLIVKNAANAIEFYKNAFGAVELMRLSDQAGKIRHAQIKIGDSPIMLADEFPEHQAICSHGSSTHIYLYVENVDLIAKQALLAGAKELMPVKDQFYGDRSGGFVDPYGHIWWIATHKEDVSLKEIERRADVLGK